MKDSQYPLVSLFALGGGILCLFLFCYYAIRAHCYKTFMQNKGQQLNLSYLKRVVKGKLLAIYIPSKYSEKMKEIKFFLENDISISALTLWYLNKRIRSWNCSIATSKFKEKIESKIIDAVHKEFEINIVFYVSDTTENITELDDMNITQVYSNYDEWKKLKVKNTDVPWFICRFVVILCITGIVLFSIVLIARHI